MHLNPYGSYAVQLAGSLADDWPADAPGVLARMREFGMTMDFTIGPHSHEACREVVEQWLCVVDTADGRARAALVNTRLAEAAALPQLTDHDDEGWHLHYRDPNVTELSSVLAAVVWVGTAFHLTGRGMHRLSRCAASPCRRVVVDLSRNGTQRYCSPRCGSRDAVRRHRARGRR